MITTCDELIEALIEAGWKSPCDAQWTNIREKVWPMIDRRAKDAKVDEVKYWVSRNDSAVTAKSINGVAIERKTNGIVDIWHDFLIDGNWQTITAAEYEAAKRPVEPVKPVEARSCENCGNGPHCSARCVEKLCSISDSAKNGPCYFANWIPKAKTMTLADFPQLSNKETRKLVQELLARVEKLEKGKEWK